MKYNAVLEVKQVETDPVEPCTLAEAKQWCKIELDIAEENTLITELITVARKIVEGYLCISLVDKTVTAVLINQLGSIELPYGPVKAISSVTDSDNVALTVDTGYEITGVEFKRLKTDFDWIKLVYTTGYTDVPVNFKTAVLQQVLYLYENRGDAQLSPMIKNTLNAYRRVW